MADSPSNQETQGYAHAVSNHDRRLATETGMAGRTPHAMGALGNHRGRRGASAGSLPKPEWLAEPNTLWAPWKSSGAELARAKRDATMLAVKLQEDAGVDIVTEGEQARQAFVPGFLEQIEGIDFAHKVEMGIRKDRYKAMVPQVVAPLTLKGRVHADEARVARTHTTRKLKFPLPGPMTIADTVADKYYGDRNKVAFAFAELVNN